MAPISICRHADCLCRPGSEQAREECLNRKRNNLRKERIMAVVRSLEGTFYDIPDSELEQYKVPADQVKGLMEAAGQKLPPSPGPATTGEPGPGPGRSRRWIAASDPCPVHNAGPRRRSPQQRQPQAAQAEGEEKVEPQWYWINWANWANWYNWY